MLLEYQLYWIKIVDFLLRAKFWASPNNFYSPSNMLVTMLHLALPGLTTWHRGPIGIFCHFGEVLPIWRFWQLFGRF